MLTEPHPYAQRMNRVLDYIGDHLEEELTVERLAEVARSSRFHFQRQFKAYTGVTVARMIRLLRLKRAAFRLAFSPRFRVIDIAVEAGFASPEAFARAFKSVYRQTPSEFRDAPHWRSAGFAVDDSSSTSPNGCSSHSPRSQKVMQLNIVEFPETSIAALEHRGSPKSLMNSVSQFIEWRKASGLSPINTSRTFGIPYSDPEQTPAADWRFDICGSVTQSIPPNPQGVVQKTIPSGRCAVAEHVGSTDRINETVLPMYQRWLPDSGEELRDYPCFFEYVRRMPEVAEHEQLTRVYLPIE